MMITMEIKNWTLLWLLLISILLWTKNALGQLTLSPMTVAPVCRVGDPLNLTCTSSIRFITLSISGPRVNEQGDFENIINDEPINSEDPLQMPRPIMISLANFTFMRISAQGELPLVTTLSIDSVSLGLNGTVVRCIPQRQDNMSMPASTTIRIIDTSQRIQLISGLNILEPHYDATNVTVTVEWDQREQGIVYYSVKISPFVPTGYFTEATRYQLTIPYDETFNFSVIASTPCRPNDTTFITLNYGIETTLESRPTCTDSTSGLATAVSSTVIVFIVISILTFIGGFISGLYIDRKLYRDSASKRTSHVTAEGSRQVPVYDNILLDTSNQQEKNLELKKNMAYLQSKPTVRTAAKVN